ARDRDSWPRAAEAVRLLGRAGCHSEVVLPVLVMTATTCHRYWPNSGEKDAAAALREFLTRLPWNREAWTLEDRWVATIRGQPLGSTCWLIFADWLEDGDDPRAELLRLLSEEACDPAGGAVGGQRFAERVDKWGEVNGHG